MDWDELQEVLSLDLLIPPALTLTFLYSFQGTIHKAKLVVVSFLQTGSLHEIMCQGRNQSVP